MHATAPLSDNVHWQARPKMSILGLLRNPMLLMTMLPLVFVGLSKLLPKEFDLKELQKEAERARNEQYETKEDLEDEDESESQYRS